MEAGMDGCQPVTAVSAADSHTVRVGAKHEAERLAALATLELIDTPPEQEFDDLVELAATICGTPYGLVTLLDESRQWFKATYGVTVRQTDRSVAFCNHTIQQSSLLLIEDTQLDERLAANPDVTGGPKYRFYAGVPISSPDGHTLGSLCVLDTVPRCLSKTQQESLAVLGRQVNVLLQLRQERLALKRALRATDSVNYLLKITEQRFQAFMDASPFISYLKDAKGRILFHNSGLPETLGIGLKTLVGKTDFDLWPEAYARDLRRHELDVMESGTLHVVEEVSVNADGSERYWRSYKFPCPAKDGEFLLGGMSVDLTDERRREAELHSYRQALEKANAILEVLAATDSLTGAATRRSFEERMKAEFQKAMEGGLALAVAMVDVDGLNQLNERYGHKAGDECLQQLTVLLQASARKNDLVARYGGAEFALLLPETDEDEAQELGERILNAVRSFAWPHQSITVSIGVAALDEEMIDPEELVRETASALYVAKYRGKDRVSGHWAKSSNVAGPCS